jgi:hypothetical protein
MLRSVAGRHHPPDGTDAGRPRLSNGTAGGGAVALADEAAYAMRRADAFAM